jgi:queuine tRNA-ribosyltransferase
LEATDPGSQARAGRLGLSRGEVTTPVFMPVGTCASVKGMLPRDVRDVGAQIVLGNTYHLLLRPGPDVVERAGGLPRFMGWDGPMLTDSGGFQVWSLADARKITEEGVRFKSHVDGASVMLTPERSIAVQEALGADIIMAFDECPSATCTRHEAERAVDRTVRWLERCVQAHARPGQALFGIQQGALDPELRRSCTERILEHDLPGYAVGGLAVGEERGATYEALAAAAPMLPAEKPRYLMGVGKPEDLVDAIHMGIDMFDCVLPTRNARNSTVYTFDGRMNMRNRRWVGDQRPIDEACDAYCCSRFSRNYLRHLFKAGEQVAGVIASIHNLRFYFRLTAQARQAILAGRYAAWRAAFHERYRAGAATKA